MQKFSNTKQLNRKTRHYTESGLESLNVGVLSSQKSFNMEKKTKLFKAFPVKHFGVGHYTDCSFAEWLFDHMGSNSLNPGTNMTFTQLDCIYWVSHGWHVTFSFIETNWMFFVYLTYQLRIASNTNWILVVHRNR